jgi:hypothetical protein
VIIGLVAGGTVADSGALGRGLLLAGPVFGVCVLAGVVAGEISVPPLGGQARTAVLEVRRVRDYLPRALAKAVMAATAVLLALITVTTATAGADDLGRAGRVLMFRCRPGCLVSAGALLSFSCHPAWWTYAGWALLALLIPAVALMGWCAAVLLTPARAVTSRLPAR